MKFCRISLPLLSALFAVTASAQGPEPRLHGSIRENARAILPGSISPRVLQAPDLGQLPATQRLSGITLVFSRSKAQEADLQKLLAAQQDPASPEFHHWLTPENFGQRFGIADSDLETTKGWLGAHGFEITGVSRARDRITFSGTAQQVSDAFATTIHRFQVDGEPHFSPSSDLSLPADLAAITTAVLHLSDFRPHPLYHFPARPAYTTIGTQAHYLTPRDLGVMYGFSQVTYSGSGHSVAVVGQSFVDTSPSSEVQTFQLDVGASNYIAPVLVPGSGVQAISPGDLGESQIDLEYASGIAPNANIFFVYVGDDPAYNVFDSLAFAIDQKVAEVISISYSQCETLLSPTELAQNNALFEQANSQGQTLVAAAGDTGGTSCVVYPTSGQFTAAQQQALAVSFPASSPRVTSVGGTQMAPGTFDSGASTYWAPAATSDNVKSLLSYVPEVAWNEGSAERGILAGGGGASFAYPRPDWQSSFPGIPAGTTRLLPDIALQSSVASPGFLVCTDDQYLLSSQNNYSSCAGDSVGSNGIYTITGGTSFAAPIFAGIVARLNQAQQSDGLGNLNPTLYNLAATSPAIFHDITSGSTACVSGAPRCGAAGQSAFQATGGYDQATGLGSLDFGRLISALTPAQSSSRQLTFVLVALDTYTAPTGGTVPIPIYVDNANPQPHGDTIPTGTVTVSVDGIVVVPSLTLVNNPNGDGNGTANYNFVAPATSGSHLVSVAYSGDADHSPSNSTVSVLVGDVAPSGNITLVAGNLTLPANGSTPTTVTVTPTGGYNGRLFWSLSLTGGNGTDLPKCYTIAPLLVRGTTSTQLVLGSGTACSSTPLPAARSAPLPLTVHAATELRSFSPWSSVPVAINLLLCSLLPISRRRRPVPLLGAFLVAFVCVLSGCSASGSGSGGNSTPPPVSPATFTATLTGRDSVKTNIIASTSFTIIVK